MVPSRQAAATRLGLLALLPGLFAGLVACASLDPTEKAPAPLIIPASWAEADAAGAGASNVTEASLAQWWQRFDDAQLEGLVQIALQANTSVQAAMAALRQARALRDVAAASLWPTLGSAASAQQGTAGGHGTGSNFKLGLDADWGIDVFGARGQGLEAGNASAAASEAAPGGTGARRTAS
jgi:outer membrane protein TolC